MSRVSLIHKSNKITGRYDYRRGFISTPYDPGHTCFVRMYDITNKWWHRFKPNKRIRIVVPIEEHDTHDAWRMDDVFIDFVAARIKYNAMVRSWVYFDKAELHFHKWIEVEFQSKRDAMLIKLAWI